MPELATALHRMPLHAAPLGGEPGWGSTTAPGRITLATAPGLPAAERDVARAKLVALADHFVGEEVTTGYHIPFGGTAYVWG